MDIEFDSIKAASNLKKHGVSFNEAASCLLDPHALVMEDYSAMSEWRWTLLGMSCHAQLLLVVYTLRNEERIRLISARKASHKEVKQYAKRL